MRKIAKTLSHVPCKCSPFSLSPTSENYKNPFRLFLTSCPEWFLYETHAPSAIPSRQYSSVNSSANSCPRPPPNLPCVPVLRMRYGLEPRSTSSHSRTPGEMVFLGHHAPPKLSRFTLKKSRYQIKLWTHGKSYSNCYEFP